MSKLYAAKWKFTFIFSILFFQMLSAQDSYHLNLQNELASNFQLPQGKWVFGNNEDAKLNADYTWGTVEITNEDASEQAFSKLVNLNITEVDGPIWSSGYGIRNANPIQAGDRCLFVVWLRSTSGPGKVGVSLQNAVSFESEFSLEFELGNEWRQYLVPVEISADFAADALQLVLLLNGGDQNIQLGGLAQLNYEDRVAFSDLPRKYYNELYEGYEADAEWRAEAAARIDQIRKAQLEIKVEDQSGASLEGVSVQARMLQHDFGFGTAVAAHLFAGNSRQNNEYEKKLLDLDGKGHGFNEVVFENATKWRAWEENWFQVNPQQKAQTIEWLKDRGMRVRGHTLIWPSWRNLPADLRTNEQNPEYIKTRILDHIEDIVNYPGVKGNISDWDVLNEISILDDLEMAMKGAPGYPTGREIYVDIFKKLLEEDPNAVTYLNDYTVFGGGSSPFYKEQLKQYTQELLDADVKVDGIGFQAHIGTFPTGVNELYDIFEEFHTTFGTRTKITEFDMNPLIDDELAAKYLKDFYTIAFSHRSMDAILMWGFWDGAHWFDNAPVFNEDWSLKPAGQAFLDLVFKEWWTDETGSTDGSGTYGLRGFKGTYEIAVGCPSGIKVDTIQLTQDLDYTLSCANLTSAEEEAKIGLKVFPNPVKDQLFINWNNGEPADIYIMDISGKKVGSALHVTGDTQMDLDLPAGIYQLMIEMKQKRITKKLVVVE